MIENQSASVIKQSPLIDKQSNHDETSSQRSKIMNKIKKQVGDNVVFKQTQILIGQNQELYVIFMSKKEKSKNFYLGHGFGGTSLMYFPMFKHLLEEGNIVAWEIRGMGFCNKSNYSHEEWKGRENQFFSVGFEKVLQHFQHPNIVIISHSFSAYITLRYLLQHPPIPEIKQLILLSPIGLTTKQKDYKNKISSCSDIWHTLYSKFGWKFRLTYKSPLRCILFCMKGYLLRKLFEQFPMSQTQKQTMVQIFLQMINMRDGSQDLFFNYFLPRVLPQPQNSIQQIIEKGGKIMYKTRIVYGGKKDWVDKQFAYQLSKIEPLVNCEEKQQIGHMIVFYPQQLLQIIDEKKQN